MSRHRRISVIITLLLLFLIIFPLIWRSSLKRQYGSRIFDVSEAPKRKTAVVFGAAVLSNGRLSSVLRDRMNTAIQLYLNGKVDNILVSGYLTGEGYDEPGAMMAYAIENGIEPDDLFADYGGKRTYDTCYRAGRIFELDSVILVTQAFHLPRALFTCNTLGVQAVGVSADQRAYRAASWYEIRETIASTVALMDVVRGQQPALLGPPMPIR
ncbi:MAG: ElyC/SanA/YdcF family protein [Anaerolineae bacterium]|nr:MAG: ElyC/SanA/YdcF family protein [Anaerolineae bacterium]